MVSYTKRIITALIIMLLINTAGGTSLIFAGESAGQPPVTVKVEKYSNVNMENDLLILVNKQKSLSSDYIPENLRAVKARCTPRILQEQKLMQKDAAKALEEMFTAAEKNRIVLYCVSGYRSYETQKNVYKYKLKNLGEKMVKKYVAFPGNSEHQTGLAMDVTNKNGINKSLSESFAKTKEGKWLIKNAYKYGFVIRYPYGKEKVTGYSYEPWHVRYVGKEAAQKMAEGKIVLEEYLDKLNSQLDTQIIE